MPQIDTIAHTNRDQDLGKKYFGLKKTSKSQFKNGTLQKFNKFIDLAQFHNLANAKKKKKRNKSKN